MGIVGEGEFTFFEGVLKFGEEVEYIDKTHAGYGEGGGEEEMEEGGGMSGGAEVEDDVEKEDDAKPAEQGGE